MKIKSQHFVQLQGQVVQSSIGADAVINFNPLFWFIVVVNGHLFRLLTLSILNSVFLLTLAPGPRKKFDYSNLLD